MKIGYYFIITYGKQFDEHWLYKDRVLSLQYESFTQYTINKVYRIKVTERDRLR